MRTNILRTLCTATALFLLAGFNVQAQTVAAPTVLLCLNTDGPVGGGTATPRGFTTAPNCRPAQLNQPLEPQAACVEPEYARANTRPTADYAKYLPALLETIKGQQLQIATLYKQAVVLSQRAAESENHLLQRVARAEAATAALQQRLRSLETGGMPAVARR